ncbi:MAG: lasso peptide biosynthesis B2 protein [Rectinemataceae bacterium]|nr:lasso peptide biosynthesis B2 protein [Rectinemataceae bacterium]
MTQPDPRNTGRRLFAFARRHSASDLIAIAGIWTRLAFVDLRLKAIPYRFSRRWLFDRGAVDNAIPDPALRSEALRLDHLVDIAAAHPLFFTMSCLRRALVLRSLLASRGFGSHLVFGVRSCPGEPGPAAHTWLEADGLKLGLGSTQGEPGFISFRRK